jgi:hypothetical protein
MLPFLGLERNSVSPAGTPLHCCKPDNSGASAATKELPAASYKDEKIRHKARRLSQFRAHRLRAFFRLEIHSGSSPTQERPNGSR